MPNPSDDLIAANSSTATRRAVILAGSATSASFFLPAKTQAQTLGSTEGFFFVHDQNTDVGSEARVFFIPSQWLDCFEITDAYNAKYGAGMSNQLVTTLRNAGITPGRRRRFRKFLSFYCDDGDVNDLVSGATVILPEPPTTLRTYLAMSISPGYTYPTDDP